MHTFMHAWKPTSEWYSEMRSQPKYQQEQCQDTHIRASFKKTTANWEYGSCFGAYLVLQT